MGIVLLLPVMPAAKPLVVPEMLTIIAFMARAARVLRTAVAMLMDCMLCMVGGINVIVNE